MEPDVRAFGDLLANTALARDWEGVHDLLAPWLKERLSVAEVRGFFEDDYAEILNENNISGTHFPELPYVSGNDSSLAFLREASEVVPRPRPIPAEVTDDNFRQWMKLQLLCSEEQADALGFDHFTEVWLIVVAHDGYLRVGYWSHNPYECGPIEPAHGAS